MTVRHWARDAGWVQKVPPVEGMIWHLSPDNPAPDGFWCHKGSDGQYRLVAYSTSSRGWQSSGKAVPVWVPGVPGFTAVADALLAQAKAAGWTPAGRPDPAVWCGRCGPCRNGSRSQCLYRGTAHAAACRKADREEDRRGLARVAPSFEDQLAELEADLSAGWRQELAERERSWVWAG